MSILTLNCGSSSVKYAVFDPATGSFTCRGLVDRVGQSTAKLKHKGGTNGESVSERTCPDHTAAVAWVLEVLTGGPSPALRDRSLIRAVGHRVVHGGEKFARSAKITEEMLGVVEQLSELAPLHNPP